MPRTVKISRWIARIICLIITLFGGIILVGESIGEITSNGFIFSSLEGGLLALIGLIALAGFIFSWWRDLTAGILLLITSAGLGIHIGFFAGRNHFLAWTMLGLPYLVSGALLLYTWNMSRKMD